jgi:hypothetical protein
MTEHPKIGLAEYHELIEENSKTPEGVQNVLEFTAQALEHLKGPQHSIILYEKLPDENEQYRAHVASLLRGETF